MIIVKCIQCLRPTTATALWAEGCNIGVEKQHQKTRNRLLSSARPRKRQFCVGVGSKWRKSRNRVHSSLEIESAFLWRLAQIFFDFESFLDNFCDPDAPWGSLWGPLGAPWAPLGVQGRKSDENHGSFLMVPGTLWEHFFIKNRCLSQKCNTGVCVFYRVCFFKRNLNA